MAEPDGVFDDYLGRLYMFSGTSSSSAGQFFTPYSVAKLCAEMTINTKDISNQQIITLNEPTCGSGGMVLAGVEVLRNKGINYADRLLVVCGDLDKRCVHMAYLQLALAGVPAIILHQNALTLETWDEWHTPVLCLNWMRFRRTIKYFNHQMTEEEMKEYLEWNQTYNASETIQTSTECEATETLQETPQNLSVEPVLEETPINTQPQEETAVKEESATDSQPSATPIKEEVKEEPKEEKKSKGQQMSLFDFEF